MSYSLMTSCRRIAVFSALALLAAPAYPQASSPLGFVKIDGIQCSSNDPAYSDWCELIGFSWGSSNAVSSEAGGRDIDGRATQRPSIGDATIVKAVDRASPKIFEFVASGKHVKDAVIVLLDRPSRTELLRIALSAVIVSAVSYGPAQESVSLDFGKVVIRHVPSGVVGGWDVIQGRVAN